MRRYKKLAFFTCGLLVGYSGTVNAMWTEDSQGNTIKPPSKKEKLNKVDPQIIKVVATKKPNVVATKKPNTAIAKFDQIKNNDINVTPYKIVGQTQKDIACLAYSIFREAGTLPAKDQAAVAQVHVNRLRTGSWGTHLCQVVYAKAQFSWTLEKRNVKWSQKEKTLAETIAKGFIDGLRVHPLDSNKILHYHTTAVHPKWGRQGQVVASAGPHIFYKDVPY